MNTEAGTRRGRTRTRRTRAFAVSFAIVAAVLGTVGLVGAAAGVAQGPRVTEVHVDPATAAAASGSRLIVTTSQSLEPVRADQVTVTPAVPFSVDTSGRSVGVRFGLPLHDETEYRVRFDDVRGVGGGPGVTLTHTFRTPPAEVFILQRTESGDTVFRTDLTGEEAVPVFSHEHIEDFRATSSHLVMSVREGDRARLVVTDLEGGAERDLALPGDGFVTNLQSADRSELIGYTFSDADLDETGGLESALFTVSLKQSAAHAEPAPVVVTGAEPRVAEWRFVPDTDNILLLTFDGSLLVTDPKGETATALGTALAIEGIARGSSQAVVLRGGGMVTIDLADASEAALAPADVDLGLLGAVTPVPGGGTIRLGAPTDAAGIPIGTTVAAATDDGSTTVLMELPSTDVALQTCVSPSGRYAALVVAPDAVTNRYDLYRLPMPKKVQTRIVEIAGGEQVLAINGFDISWCQVPPR
ncbi:MULTISPECIES: hypothetical protein [unclassified Microbacterium]|uniref:hypothetical protein n=1 Tax=unclassified Microbacterium TaxID=2609290 RepID=UPI00214ABB37|nr:MULTISPECIES: hypothetical protein [unclassified Microbacterium]MCR2808353.1 hypothetical protein [Microbacterium sp. zg.B185]WIM19198.1 hypothetical protein QNO12_16745 [Microbacterium sp. zg-B185]